MRKVAIFNFTRKLRSTRKRNIICVTVKIILLFTGVESGTVKYPSEDRPEDVYFTVAAETPVHNDIILRFSGLSESIEFIFFCYKNRLKFAKNQFLTVRNCRYAHEKIRTN